MDNTNEPDSKTGNAKTGDSVEAKKAFRPFSNDKVFSKVMGDESICRRVLERILGRKIAKVTYHSTEEQIVDSDQVRGVRMDVYIEGDDELYDVEMQSTREPYLKHRFRYYQCMLDHGTLKPGEDYIFMPTTYIIFLCDYDPFGQGLPRYTRRSMCLESSRVDFECDTNWIVVNAKAWRDEPDEGLRDLLRYISDREVAKGDNLIEEIDERVMMENTMTPDCDGIYSISKVEENAERRVRLLIHEAHEEGFAEGEAAGASKEAAKYSALVTKLANEGRLEELAAATEDPAKLEALFSETA